MSSQNNPFLKIKIRTLGLWLLLMVFLYGVILTLLSLFTPLKLEDASVSEILFILLGYGMVLCWALRQLKNNQAPLKLIFGEMPQSKKLLLNILYVIPLLSFSMGAFVLFYYLLSFPFPKFVEGQLNLKYFLTSAETAAPLFYNTMQFVIGIIIAPFIEEIIFRGMLLHRWGLKWSMNKALIVSSLIFAVFHADIIGSFVFGLVMGIIYIKTKTLWIPIIIHMINNTISLGMPVLLALIEGTAVTQIYTISQLRADLYIGIFLFAIPIPFVGYYLYRNWPSQSKGFITTSNYKLTNG